MVIIVELTDDMLATPYGVTGGSAHIHTYGCTYHTATSTYGCFAAFVFSKPAWF